MATTRPTSTGRPFAIAGRLVDLVLLGVSLALLILGAGRASVDEDVLHREFI